MSKGRAQGGGRTKIKGFLGSETYPVCAPASAEMTSGQRPNRLGLAGQVGPHRLSCWAQRFPKGNQVAVSM